MVPWWWSWLLTTVGIVGLLLAGSRRRTGWAVGVAAQALWVCYALATRQYGFILAACCYAAAYARNWWKWRQEDDAAAGNPDSPPGSSPHREGP